MILTEEMRLLSGLQSNEIVVNPILEIIENEKQQELNNDVRLKNKKKIVLTGFSSYREKVNSYYDMILTVKKLLSSDFERELISGVVESKYPNLQKFVDVVVNDDIGVVFKNLNDEFLNIKKEIDEIESVLNLIEENNAQVYFVSSDKLFEMVEVPLYKDKNLLTEIFPGDNVPYGAKITQLHGDLISIKFDGKRFFSKLSSDKIDELVKKGILI